MMLSPDKVGGVTAPNGAIGLFPFLEIVNSVINKIILNILNDTMLQEFFPEC